MNCSVQLIALYKGEKEENEVLPSIIDRKTIQTLNQLPTTEPKQQGDAHSCNRPKLGLYVYNTRFCLSALLTRLLLSARSLDQLPVIQVSRKTRWCIRDKYARPPYLKQRPKHCVDSHELPEFSFPRIRVATHSIRMGGLRCSISHYIQDGIGLCRIVLISKCVHTTRVNQRRNFRQEKEEAKKKTKIVQMPGI